jgi:hypothetical protein
MNLFSTFLFVSMAAISIGQLPDQTAIAIDSACRITRSLQDGRSILGSGTVLKSDADQVWVLTCGHVCPNLHEAVHAEFWLEGHSSGLLPAETLWVSYSGSPPRDLAVLTVSASAFPAAKPRSVQLAPEGFPLEIGQTVLSTGCPRGDWPAAFRGHLVKSPGSVLTFVPRPAQGRSGSGLLDASGRYLIGVVAWQSREDWGTQAQGMAVGLEEIYRAINGQPPGTLHYFDTIGWERIGQSPPLNPWLTESGRPSGPWLPFPFRLLDRSLFPDAPPQSARLGSSERGNSAVTAENASSPTADCPTCPPNQDRQFRGPNNPWNFNLQIPIGPQRPRSDSSPLEDAKDFPWPVYRWKNWLLYSLLAYALFRWFRLNRERIRDYLPRPPNSNDPPKPNA